MALPEGEVLPDEELELEEESHHVATPFNPLLVSATCCSSLEHLVDEKCSQSND